MKVDVKKEAEKEVKKGLGQKVEADKPLCCVDVVTDETMRGATGCVCTAGWFTTLLARGLTDVQYGTVSQSCFRPVDYRYGKPSTFQGCLPNTKRFLIFAQIFKELIVRENGFDKKQKRRKYGVCMKAAVRRAWPDVTVKAEKEEGLERA